MCPGMFQALATPLVKTIITAGSEISEETVRVWLTDEESLITEENKAIPGGLCKYFICQHGNGAVCNNDFSKLVLSHGWKCEHFLLLQSYIYQFKVF